MLRSIVLFLTLLMSCFGGHSQDLPYPGQWIGDLFLVRHIAGSSSQAINTMAFIDDNNIIHPVHPNMDIPVDFKVPEKYGSFAPQKYWYNDALYVLASTPGKLERAEDGSTFIRYNFLKWQEGEWHFLGDYKDRTSRSSWLRFFPCDNDRFIIISGVNELVGKAGRESTPFYRMSIRPGSKPEIKLDSPIDPRFDELREQVSNPIFFRMAANSLYLIANNYGIIVHPNTGLYWVFSLERASLTRAGTIFRKVTPEIIVQNGWVEAITCVNPEKDGTVLLSAVQLESVLLDSDNTWGSVSAILTEHPSLSDVEAYTKFKERVEELKNRNSNLDWYRIDPESGRLEKISAPEGGAYEREAGKSNAWRPLLNGSVRMGEIKISEKSPEKISPPKENNDEKRTTQY